MTLAARGADLGEDGRGAGRFSVGRVGGCAQAALEGGQAALDRGAEVEHRALDVCDRGALGVPLGLEVRDRLLHSVPGGRALGHLAAEALHLQVEHLARSPSLFLCASQRIIGTRNRVFHPTNVLGYACKRLLLHCQCLV